MTQDDLMIGKQPIMINAKVFFSIATLLVGGGFWIGTTVMSIKATVQSVQDQQRAVIDHNAAQDATEASNTNRINVLEQASARDGARYDAVLSSIGDLKQQMAQNTDLLRQVLQQSVRGSLPTHGGN